MALINCPECSRQISDKAVACPHCGAPVTGTPQQPATAQLPNKPAEKKATLKDVVGGLFMIFIFLALLGQCTSPSSTTTAKDKSACSADDLQCHGDNGTVAAGVYCADKVEKLAKYSVRWTDEMLEPKFSRFRWANDDHTAITFIGNKAEFQNGFGAYTPIVYECDMALDKKTILDVRVHKGRI